MENTKLQKEVTQTVKSIQSKLELIKKITKEKYADKENYDYSHIGSLNKIEADLNAMLEYLN